MEKKLYEIQIPVSPNEIKAFDLRCDSNGRFTDEYHREFLDRVLREVGGYTRFPIVEGAWMGDNQLYKEQMIPVRMFTDADTMGELAAFAKTHYEQEAIFVAELGTAKFF